MRFASCSMSGQPTTETSVARRRSCEKRSFALAAEKHPLVTSPDRLFESSEQIVKQQIADELGMSWGQIERALFADVMQFHRLKEFEGYASAAELLARYNVAQCQAVLYDAVSMVVWAREDFKLILRYAKLARLMHTIQRRSDGTYLISLDGPTSDFAGNPPLRNSVCKVFACAAGVCGLEDESDHSTSAIELAESVLSLAR